MSWVIRGYGEDDQLVTEVFIDEVLRERFRSELALPSSDPMLGSLAMSQKLVESFLTTLGLDFNASDHPTEDFFLDFDA